MAKRMIRTYAIKDFETGKYYAGYDGKPKFVDDIFQKDEQHSGSITGIPAVLCSDLALINETLNNLAEKDNDMAIKKSVNILRVVTFMVGEYEEILK